MTLSTAIQYLRGPCRFIVTMPNGAETTTTTRVEAERAYMTVIAPELVQRADSLATCFPALAERIHRATLIVVDGGVRLLTGQFTINHYGIQVNTVAVVHSQTDANSVYEIFSARGQLACNCQDANPVTPNPTNAPATKFAQHTCQHILAYLLSA